MLQPSENPVGWAMSWSYYTEIHFDFDYIDFKLSPYIGEQVISCNKKYKR